MYNPVWKRGIEAIIRRHLCPDRSSLRPALHPLRSPLRTTPAYL